MASSSDMFSEITQFISQDPALNCDNIKCDISRIQTQKIKQIRMKMCIIVCEGVPPTRGKWGTCICRKNNVNVGLVTFHPLLLIVWRLEFADCEDYAFNCDKCRMCSLKDFGLALTSAVVSFFSVSYCIFIVAYILFL